MPNGCVDVAARMVEAGCFARFPGVFPSWTGQRGDEYGAEARNSQIMVIAENAQCTRKRSGYAVRP